jgi:hypothetical protein
MKKLLSRCGSLHYCVHIPEIRGSHLGHKIGYLEWGHSLRSSAAEITLGSYSSYKCICYRKFGSINSLQNMYNITYHTSYYVKEMSGPTDRHTVCCRTTPCRPFPTTGSVYLQLLPSTFRSRPLQPQHEDAASRGDKKPCRLLWTRHWTSIKCGEYFKTKKKFLKSKSCNHLIYKERDLLSEPWVAPHHFKITVCNFHLISNKISYNLSDQHSVIE